LVEAIHSEPPIADQRRRRTRNRSESDTQFCGNTIRSIPMSEITRVYKLGAITGAALIAAAAVVAVLGTVFGA